MSLTDILKLIDAGGSVALCVVVIFLVLRLERAVGATATAVHILVERTRGLRVVRHGRSLTVTLDPPVDEPPP